MRENTPYDLFPGGFLFLDKPSGISSFQSIRHVKRVYKGQKVGFAGTLDPDATGLMIIGVGCGTRLMNRFEAMPKHYQFTLVPGIVTDSYDTTGKIVKRSNTDGISRQEVEAVVQKFVGAIEQVPPVYSALKIKGKRACDRTRAGETVTLNPRRVVIHSLELVDWKEDNWGMEVTCSKGAYVRSLAHDIGAEIGCGGAAAEIRRTAVGAFQVEDAIAWDDVEGMKELHPLQTALKDFPIARISFSSVKNLVNGMAIGDSSYQMLGESKPGEEAVFRIQDAESRLLGLGTIGPDRKLCPSRVFVK